MKTFHVRIFFNLYTDIVEVWETLREKQEGVWHYLPTKIKNNLP